MNRIMAIIDELGLDEVKKQRIFAGTTDERFGSRRGRKSSAMASGRW